MEDHSEPDIPIGQPASQARRDIPSWLAILQGTILVFLGLIYGAVFFFSKRISEVGQLYDQEHFFSGAAIRWVSGLFVLVHFGALTGIILNQSGKKSGFFIFMMACLVLFILTFYFSGFTLITPWIYLFIALPFLFNFLRSR
jgi:uncharacterized oligopeptide transporter (OPT) family protein